MDNVPMLDLFAGELRRLRTAAGLSQEALAERINYSASLVAAVEQCRRPPRLEFAQKCDEALGSAGLLVRIREAIVRESMMPWLREWVSIEQDATALRSFQPLVIPGLLQTEDYARGTYAGSQLSAGEVEQMVAGRVSRQTVLHGPQPPMLVAVLDYTTLERPVGGPSVMREQLLHLLTVGQLPQVHLHLVPRGTGGYPGFSGAFVIATQPEGSDVAYLDNQLRGTIVERAADVLLLRRAWESVRAEALPHGQTLKLISEAAETWT